MGYVKTIKLTLTIPGGAGAGTVVVAQFVDDPSVGAVNELQIPINEVWYLVDIYTKSAPGVDVQIEFVKNRKEVKYRTPPVSALVQSNPSRPIPPVLVYLPGDILSAKAITLEANSGTAAVTVDVFIDVEVETVEEEEE